MDTDVALLSNPVSPLLELGPPSPPPEDHPNQEQLPMEQLLHDDEPLAPLLMVAQPPIGFEDSPSKTKATSPPGMFTLFSSAICLLICKFVYIFFLLQRKRKWWCLNLPQLNWVVLQLVI